MSAFVDVCPKCGNEVTYHGRTINLCAGLQENGNVKIVFGTIDWFCPVCWELIAVTDHNGKSII